MLHEAFWSFIAAMVRISYYAFIALLSVQSPGLFTGPKPIKRLSIFRYGEFVLGYTNTFHPADIVGSIKFDSATYGGHLDCLISCSHYQNCASINFIPAIKVCLLSSSRIFLRTYFGATGVEFFDSMYFSMDGKSVYSYPTGIGHGKRPDGCGTNSLNYDTSLRSKRIIDGWTPLPYNIPWMGSLVKDGKSICSATLISRKSKDSSTVWVLIAAHCVYREYDEISMNSDDNLLVDYSRFGFLFGVHDLRLSTTHIVFRKISKIYRHLEPSDLALVKLSKPVRFNAYINGLCLPDEPEEADMKQFLKCFTCGWGATKAVALPLAADQLQCIDVEVVEDKEDYTRRGSLLTLWWSRGPPKGPFRGDSGSPLFCRLMDSAQKFLFGVIVSGTEFPTITTVIERIPQYMEWINGIVDRNGPLIPELFTKQKCCFSFRVVDAK